jgi:hypothetical protein
MFITGSDADGLVEGSAKAAADMASIRTADAAGAFTLD